MTLRVPAKVLLHVWSYDFYDTTLSTATVTPYDKYFFLIISNSNASLYFYSMALNPAE